MASRRRRRHFGSIREVKKGKVYYLRWTENTPHGRDKPHETVYGTFSEACARMSEIEVRVRSEGRDRTVPTFGYAFNNWYLPACERRIEARELKQRSLDQYKKAYERAISGRWADVPVTEISAQGVEDWLMGYTKSVGAIYKPIMKSVLDECIKRTVIQGNPLAVRLVQSSKGAKRDKGIWTLDQLDELAWMSRDEAFFYSVILMAFGSCRPGESLAPRLDEIHERECRGMRFAEVEINRQVLNGGGVTDENDLKNKFSKRRVFIPEPWCYPVLKAKSEASDERVLLTDDGYGMYVRQKRISNMFKKSFDGDGNQLEYHPLKNLRPSWQTWMNWRNHIEREKIEKLMGHVGKGVSAVYYDRPLGVQLMEEIAVSFERYPYESPYPWEQTYR